MTIMMMILPLWVASSRKRVFSRASPLQRKREERGRGGLEKEREREGERIREGGMSECVREREKEESKSHPDYTRNRSNPLHGFAGGEYA